MANKIICKFCGHTSPRSYTGYCQGCYHYFHKGGIVHPLPPKGVIKYDNDGKVICHICGRAYKRLGSHAKESHNMSIDEYKAEFELCNNARTTETQYAKHMRELAYKHKMDQQLLEKGKPTRFHKGQRDARLGKPVRLQECIDKRNRYRKEA